MDRRSFISRSALGSGALVVGASTLAATGPGCGGAALGPGARSELDPAEAGALLDRLERGLATIRNVPRGTIASAMPWQVRPDLHENILRLTLEALVVTDVARSVPESTRVPQALSERLFELVPIVDRSAMTHHALLTRMPPAVRRRLNGRIRERPELAMDVAGWIDGHAAEIGIATESRIRLRNAAVSVGARIRRQSANAVIDDAVAKVDRAIARSGGEIVLARSTATTAMIDAIWQQVDDSMPRSGGSAPLAPGTYVGPAGQPPPGAEDEPRWNERWGRPGDQEIEIGAIMMPFGLLSCGLLLIIGLVVLIAGCVQNGDWNGESEEERRLREAAAR